MTDKLSTPRILIVEDDHLTLRQMRALLSEEFVTASVDGATTVEEARALLDNRDPKHAPYDVAILDFKLPARQGEVLETNQELFRKIRETTPDTVVVHTSAYMQDPELMELILDEARQSPLTRRSAFVAKLSLNWARDVVEIVRDALVGAHKLLRASAFQSCFISYSHYDEEFVGTLYSRLKNEGVQLWYAAEHMRPGRKIHEEIDSAIRLYGRLLLVLSEASMRSEWVATEIRTAIDQEKASGTRKLIPVRLVEFDALRTWHSFNADVGKDMAVELREYYIPDFCEWRRTLVFEHEVGRLLDALRM